MGKKHFKRETEILNQGSKVKGRRDKPEIPPIYMTTAFNVEDLDELMDIYEEKGYAYIRNRNPNRNALAELMSYLESAEESIIFSSGMAAISTSVMSIVERGDHILSSDTLYSETFDLFGKVLKKYGVSVSYVDFTNTEKVQQAVQSNTKILYAETISNPMMTVVDIEELANISHSNEAKLIIDNTFATPLVVRPLQWGADMSVHSLTKFANGHSDTVAGSLSASKEVIKNAYELQLILGSPLDPFSSWLCQRGLRTMDLRLEKQMNNAEKLAAALEEDPNVKQVHYPGLASHPQHKTAKKMFDGFGAMLSFEMPSDREGINAFLRELEVAHYAMTLGGYRTTLSHPVSSSHQSVPEVDRERMGITLGLMRVSVGTENPDDLVEDFQQALKVFE